MLQCLLEFYLFIYLCLSAINITVDTDGLIQAAGRGWRAGAGPSPGLSSDSGGSGGSHGGLGGRGTNTAHAEGAYDDVRHPDGAGSGGSVVRVFTWSGRLCLHDFETHYCSQHY